MKKGHCKLGCYLRIVTSPIKGFSYLCLYISQKLFHFSGAAAVSLSGSHWQTWCWHCLCKLLTKRVRMKCVTSLPCILVVLSRLCSSVPPSTGVSNTCLYTERLNGRKPHGRMWCQAQQTLVKWTLCSFGRFEKRQHWVWDLFLQIQPCCVKVDAFSSSPCPPFLSLARTPTQHFQVCLTAPGAWSDTYS